MKSLSNCSFVVLVIVLCAPPKATAQAVSGASSRSATVNGSTMTVSTSAQQAGAITSLTFRGMQYVDSTDHGREMQTAIAFNGLSECYNPTEAGSRSDGWTSTSQVKRVMAWGNNISTTSQMAYWVPTGQYYGPCPGPSTPTLYYPLNQSNLSQTFVSKSVTIGYRGLSNVLEYNIRTTRPFDEKIIYPVVDYGGGDVRYNVPQQAAVGTWEAVTGYTPASFTRAFKYTRSTNTFGEFANGLLIQGEPVIVTTSDLQHAIGVIAPDRADYVHEYITGYFPGTMKWSCVIAKSAPAAHENYTCYVIIGTLAEVQQSMRALYRNWLGDSNYPLSAPGPVPTAPTIEQVPAYSPAPGRTGNWWCSAHFGANLGGQWQCLAVQNGACNADAALNKFITCQRHNVVYDVFTYAAGPGLTPQWWCSAHFGGNLGGTWDCTNASGYACDVDVPVGTRVYCGQR